MKALEYFLNLAMFGAWLLSVFTVSENPAPLYIATLTLSTIGLTVLFFNHIKEN